MKTSELIAILQRSLAKHGDLEVETPWEGQTSCLPQAEEIYVTKDRTLAIDADSGYDKSRRAVDPDEVL